ncbi:MULTISPECIES: bifunctional 2-polyprenyl-6-hydroxyphenol methylase/3-demethylubiquinol 3-O-methyltransferase UbiG [unclassified Neisseria]|uniref:class I SAM-dependent methyltransferase n=1 Tax=unclassified Neisseria TaxID=2623750 RepID=UPI002666198A|nr:MULTISPECIES: class I SAM-dependent methyltransferase [unclassified Neisseria]MDO1510099.1 class I SAM-dependent methyltransferase [Neisseria sp. MVDL19-042950]MDO1516871.1 class I SAM-dependent methyltransferase [Neisseria sp. MVDL18-041461]MDO1564156.1 class I SAM-dependent methyltransferase [Neisseria sp. MVDL20-010259]
MSKWNERYQTEEYIFGTEPNEFIARIRPFLPESGRALDLATGEGRNGVFLARHGLDAEGVDMSAVGLEKAQKLAEAKGVRFATRLENIAEMQMPSEHYAVITSVFCHFAEPERTRVMQRIIGALQSGGLFAGVFYHPDQIGYGTGGPSDPAMLGTLEEMQNALKGLEWLIAEHSLREMNEGSRHRGTSSVICLLGRKR